MATTFVRRSIWELETPDMWDPVTMAYAKAVAEMRSRPANDPTSWSFQAAMHGTYADPLPGVAWNQCQHGSWFFLPWHRMYCYWFERIVRATVIQQGGPSDWALPFWNYSLGSPSNKLPPAFRAPTWNPGTGDAANPLFTDHRAVSYNRGAELPDSVVRLTALNTQNFTGTPLPGFGGPVTGFSHEPQRFGLLENVPHNQVHVQIGGQEQDPCQGGWMIDPNCAAEDPVFWLHHANIDRLWSTWIGLGGQRANPTDQRWQSGETYHFYDETGREVTMTCRDVLDTLGQLGYEYEPQPEPPPPSSPFAAVRPEVAVNQPPPPHDAPRLVAATDQGVTLTSGRTDVRIALPRPAQAAMLAAVDPADESAQYVYLNIEGLKADHTPGVSWEVHLNLPPGADAGAGDHLAGVISFFGFRRQLANDSDAHGLGPMVHTFDITDLVRGLRSNDEWDQLSATVSFVPVGPSLGEMATDNPRVGRVSISYH